MWSSCHSFSTALNISYVQLIDPIVVSEDAGTVEIIRVEKQGQVEKPVKITFSGGMCMSMYTKHCFMRVSV